MVMKHVHVVVAGMFLFAGCGNRESFDATGTFEATEVVVSGEETGKILYFDVEEGTQVRAGQVVGVIDTVQLYLSKLKLGKNRLSVESSRPDVRLQIAALEEQISSQLTEQKRIRNLLKDGAATAKQLDDVNSAIAVLEKQLQAQRSSLHNSVASLNEQSSSLEIQMAQLDDRLQKCRIVSPLTGTVLAKYAEAGELSTVGRPLMKVADVSHLILRAYVTSAQLAGLKIGQEVTVTADFGGEHTRSYKGVIGWISPKSEFTPKSIQTRDDRENLVYAVKIAVENDGYIKIGMYGEVKF